MALKKITILTQPGMQQIHILTIILVQKYMILFGICTLLTIFYFFQVRRIQRLVEEMDILKAKNSTPFSEDDNTVSVTTKWEKFDSGVGSFTPPNPPPAPTSATPEWEQFD